MYRLMIVDDDEVICKGLATRMDWASMGVCVAHTAYNALSALDMLRSDPVDICIVDICMPIMDGLEFTCILHDEFPQSKIILLSAFSEFDYAQKALKFGVSEYLTKPFTKETIRDAVEKVVKELDEERKQMKLFSLYAPVASEAFLQRLLLPHMLGDESPTEAAEVLGFPRSDGYYRVAALTIQPYVQEMDNASSLHTTIAVNQCMSDMRRHLEHYAGSLWFCSLSLHGFAIVVLEDAQDTPQSTRQRLEDCVQPLRQNSDLVFWMGVSVQTSELSDLPSALQTAQSAAACAPDCTNGAIIFAEESSCVSEDPLQLVLPRERIESYIQQYRFSELLYGIGRLFALMSSRQYPLHKQQTVALDILLVLFRTAEHDTLYKNIHPNLQEIMGNILRVSDSDMLHMVLQEQIIAFYQCFDREQQSSHRSLFDEICLYIQNNYMNPSLSLSKTASSVHISTSYLSYLFKKHGSTSFGNYLTRIRMEAAIKLLLSTDCKTYEISEMVGYNSPQYFNNSFKKHVGCTPSEYRHQHCNIL